MEFLVCGMSLLAILIVVPSSHGLVNGGPGKKHTPAFMGTLFPFRLRKKTDCLFIFHDKLNHDETMVLVLFPYFFNHYLMDLFSFTGKEPINRLFSRMIPCSVPM